MYWVFQEYYATQYNCHLDVKCDVENLTKEHLNPLISISVLILFNVAFKCNPRFSVCCEMGM